MRIAGGYEFPTTTCPACGAIDPTYMVQTTARVGEREIPTNPHNNFDACAECAPLDHRGMFQRGRRNERSKHRPATADR